MRDQLSAAVAAILGQRPELRLVKLADGAKDNWRFLADELRPGEGVELIDFFHASDHLSDALQVAHGKGSTKAKAQHKKYRTILRDEQGGVETVIRALDYLKKKHPRREKLATELSYFRNNRHRMQYAAARANHLPIGSGVTEAACKTLVTQRLKCSGMRWKTKGGQGVLTMRGQIRRSMSQTPQVFQSLTFTPEPQVAGNFGLDGEVTPGSAVARDVLAIQSCVQHGGHRVISVERSATGAGGARAHRRRQKVVRSVSDGRATIRACAEDTERSRRLKERPGST